MSRRLIDAEKLKAHYAWWEDDERRNLFDQIVDVQPTVDAIPIEWIEKQRKSMKKGSDREQNIGWLLKDWEKENGTETD